MPRTAVNPVAFVPNGSLDDNVGTTIDSTPMADIFAAPQPPPPSR